MSKFFINFLIASLFICKGFSQSVSGYISTSDGSPASSVNVELYDLKMFTTTDDNGYFIFKNVPDGQYKVIASYSGLQTKILNIDVKNKPVSVVVTLAENTQQLDAVIVKSSKTINEMPVTAGKVNIKPMDLPQSVVYVGENTIKQQQALRLSDVIRNVNGVYLGTTRGSAQETFFARGYNISATNMFKNGARLNNGVMPEMSSIEKVEVLKGGAAILYGNVAPGGIVNMVTKQPKFYSGGEVYFRTGSYNLIRPGFDIFGPLSKKIAFRINGVYENSESFRDVVTSEKFYFNPSFVFKASDKTEILLEGDYLKNNYTPDFGIGSIDNSQLSPLSRNTFLGTPWQYNKVDQTTAGLTIKHKLNAAWNITLNGSYQNYLRDYYSTERIQAKANGDWGRPLNKIGTAENRFNVQANLTGNFKTGKLTHLLLAGAESYTYKTKTYGYNNPTLYDSINILNPNKFTPRTDIPNADKNKITEAPVSSPGIYIQDLITLSPKFKLLAGVRWSQQITKATTTKFLDKDSISKSSTSSVDAFSPRIGLVYQPTNHTSIFASYSNSFSPNTATDVNLKPLPPSVIDQYELGVKNEFLNGLLNVNVTLYTIVNNNLAQTAQFAADGVTPNTNTSLKELVGQTTSKGIELDIQGNPVKGLIIIAGYSYNDMRFSKTVTGKGNYIEGERLVSTPQNTANASAFYAIQKGKLKNLKAGISFIYIGNRFAGWNNTQQQAQSYSRLIPVSGFSTTDISLGYTYKKFDFLTKLSNIYNTFNYYVHENYSVNPIAPRQFVGTISYRL